ncbi:MAG: menaquinone biosynthesis protein [Fuerstiella sp.]
MLSPLNSKPDNNGSIANVRLGAVSYLNSRPLVHQLAENLPASKVTLDYPSRLADALARRELEVALIPSIEYFRGSNYEILSNACVAARGPVMSVKLFCRVHPGQIRTVALDEGSRTSATLTRIVLAEKYGVSPKTEPLSLLSSTQHSEADAVLLIGDRAMHHPDESFVEVMDLGEIWNEWTGLPFVFAMWVAQKDADTTGVADVLERTRDLGVRHLHDIATTEAPGLNLTVPVAEDYLRNNLYYTMTSAERAGLNLFHQLALEHQLVNRHDSPVFTDLVTA